MPRSGRRARLRGLWRRRARRRPRPRPRRLALRLARPDPSRSAEAGYRAIAYDQRGAGLSEKPAGPYSVEGWAADLVALADVLGIERVALAGHSMGCMVAQRAAAALGRRCWALALCGGRTIWPERAGEVFEQRAALARAGRMDEVAEAVAAGGLSEACRAEQPALWGLMVAGVAAKRPRRLRRVRPGDRAAPRWPGSRSSAARCSPSRAPRTPVTPPEAAEEIAAAAPHGESAAVCGRRPLVHARGARRRESLAGRVPRPRIGLERPATQLIAGRTNLELRSLRTSIPLATGAIAPGDPGFRPSERAMP